MIYVGMDVSSKSFMVHAVNERKQVVFRGEICSTLGALKTLVEQLGNDSKLFVFEAGNQLKWLALALQKMPGVQIHVVHPNEVKWITKSNGKTDGVDARKLAELARGDLLPVRVHIVQGKVRELRELSRARSQIQSKRVGLINSLRGMAKQEGFHFPAKFFAQVNWQKKLRILPVSETLREVIEIFMKGIEALEGCEKALLKRLNQIVDPRLDLLKTIPAIGELSSRVLLGAIDEAKRFENQKKIANYAALTPTIYQSGSVVHLGRINRDGRQDVRRVLLQCAHVVARKKKTLAAKPFQDFYERIAKKRGKKIALVALARKLLTTAYGVLKSGQGYDPKKLFPHGA